MSELREPQSPDSALRRRTAAGRLAADPRVSDLSLQVHIVAEHVFVTGQVATPERVEAVSEIAARVLPDHVVHNELRVIALADEPAVEHLP